MTTFTSEDSGVACQFTGDNIDAITDLGVHVLPHPTQDAIIVFAAEGDLDPAGTAAAGQTVLVDGDGVRVVGMPDVQPLALPDDALFDPSRSNVAEVQQYLRGLDDQDEIDRVLAAERAGKARKSIVGDTPQDPADQPTPRTVPEPVDAALTAPQGAATDSQPVDPDTSDEDDDLGQHEHSAE